MDTILNQDDVPAIVEKIIHVQAKSEILGRILKLPDGQVQSIVKKYTDHQEQLFHVIDEFVKQVEPAPTWRSILAALRSPLIGAARLALEIEQGLSSTPQVPNLQPLMIPIGMQGHRHCGD